MKTASELTHDYALDHIEYAAAQITHSAQRLDVHACELKRNYQFKTRAEACLDAGEAACLAALTSIREARRIYQSKEAA